MQQNVFSTKERWIDSERPCFFPLHTFGQL